MTGVRWSSARVCARKAVYEAQDAPAREETDRERRWLYRGKSIGRDYAIFVATANNVLIHAASGQDYWIPPNLKAESAGEAGVLAEKPVRWELGVGHADMFIVETGTTVEVLSSAHGDSQVESKLLQLALYVDRDPDAKNGVLVVLNPSDFSEDRLIVNPDSGRFKELVAEANERVAQVQAGLAGDLPGRVCRRYTDSYGRFCRHADHCFDGYETPALPMVDDPVTQDLAVRLYELRKQEREATGTAKVVESERREVEQRLGDLLDPGEHLVGPIKVTRTVVQPRPSFDVRAAELAGYPVPDDFVKLVGGHERWRVDRVAS